MCGIAGYLSKGDDPQPIGRIMLDMLTSLARRGPDSVGMACFTRNPRIATAAGSGSRRTATPTSTNGASWLDWPRSPRSGRSSATVGYCVSNWRRPPMPRRSGRQRKPVPKTSRWSASAGTWSWSSRSGIRTTCRPRTMFAGSAAATPSATRACPPRARSTCRTRSPSGRMAWPTSRRSTTATSPTTTAAPHLRAAGRALLHGERLRGDRHLPRRPAGARPIARGGARPSLDDLDGTLHATWSRQPDADRLRPRPVRPQAARHGRDRLDYVAMANEEIAIRAALGDAGVAHEPTGHVYRLWRRIRRGRVGREPRRDRRRPPGAETSVVDVGDRPIRDVNREIRALARDPATRRRQRTRARATTSASPCWRRARRLRGQRRLLLRRHERRGDGRDPRQRGLGARRGHAVGHGHRRRQRRATARPRRSAAATVVVRGDCAARAGVAMKGGLLLIAGDAGYMTGFMMQKGVHRRSAATPATPSPTRCTRASSSSAARSPSLGNDAVIEEPTAGRRSDARRTRSRRHGVAAAGRASARSSPGASSGTSSSTSSRRGGHAL